MKCFLTEPRPYFLGFWAYIHVRYSVNIIIFGKFSQNYLMLHYIAQRLIEAFLIK